MNLTEIIIPSYLRKVAVICLVVLLVTISAIQVPDYTHHILIRLHQDKEMITQHKTYKKEILIEGNVLFLANSSSSWIFPSTDFNYYFFVKQNKINRDIDTVFNISLLAQKNIEQINRDSRSSFDTQVYWENEDFRRYLFSVHHVSSFGNLKKINPLEVIKEYAVIKRAAFILTDEENMKLFPAYAVVKKISAKQEYDECFSYSLLNDIYLIRIF